ncbi:hypothetical protein AVEN_59136-1 [Araneus ventricosus]|uniref:Uncharacterized protein n=1 Tax=Araneus ventricosus TaxID=182803 RepID=A0A4Y2IGV0_ARAVE|nr:hypothetical protein AVEN_59136-1 [Araneus ventricosus]
MTLKPNLYAISLRSYNFTTKSAIIFSFPDTPLDHYGGTHAKYVAISCRTVKISQGTAANHKMNIVAETALWVYGGNSPTRRIMKNEGLFTNMQEKHVAQVTETIPLIQISNRNRQQFTSNNKNSTLNTALLTGFLARTGNGTPSRSSR